MRTNMPVTNVEQVMRDGEFIVSRTDTRGIITYINRYFLEISGFTEDELIGAPHNIVRHPDMPPEAFEDLWNTLKAGKPWTGYVKNRCKNGDYYWVLANATPIWENGQITGYLSVRTKPERATVEAVDRIYRQFRAGQAGNQMVLEGAVVSKGGLAGLGRSLNNMSLNGRIMTLVGWMALTGLAAVGLALGAESGAGKLASLAVLGGGSLIGLLLGLKTYGAVAGPLRKMTEQLRQVSQGHFDIVVTRERDDEVGKATDAFKSMFIKIGFDVAEAERRAAEATRIQVALDNVNANVMMADTERKIIYMNKAVQAMFRNAQSDIRKQLPNFNADRLLGVNIDTFHKDPSHQARLLANLNGTHKGTLKIGGRTMTVVANPVINERGHRLGSVVEWADRTNEVAVEEEVAALVQAAAAGDFSQRLALEGKDGFFRQLAEGINRVVETSERGINDVADVLKALAEGDLTHRMDGNYEGRFAELRDDTNATVERLREIVAQIREATDAINTAAREIASGNTDLSARTENQAASLEETASSMDELTSTVKQNADNARQANQLAQGASGVASKGGAVVREVVNTMGAIAESSKKIADIISVIDGIAFQTNILALNAAVEAARAGEQGRGFAVVAGEVRNLAQRSAAAAKEIKQLISDSVDKVDNGYKLVEQAGSTMEEVVQSVKRVTDIMGEITAASTEQSQGIEQVNTAVAQMDEMTQQNAALVEEAAAAAESLQDQANSLSSAVSVFRTTTAAARRPAVPNLSHNPPRGGQVEHHRASKAPSRPVKVAKPAEDEWEEF